MLSYLILLSALVVLLEASRVPSVVLKQNNSSVITAHINIDTTKHFQAIDGFGISEAFQRARAIQNLPPSSQQYALDLLFNTTSGAGLSILRNGIGSSPSYNLDWMKSIAPISPGSPDGTPQYEWDGDDAGQLFITREAMRRGVQTIYADAWSAPGYMKPNGNDANGSSICGVRETECSTGDWRKAYAEYLVQYLRFYAQEGIDITHVGFVNEPDLNQTYASMQASGFQIADFLSVLHPVLQASEFADKVQVICCESTGWGDSEDILAELQSIPGAESSIDIYSSHGYSVNPALPFRFQGPEKKVWQTEWADLTGSWSTAWDYLGKDGEGISWANKIHQALTLSNTSAFFYWIGAENATTNSALVRIHNETVTPSARLWAFAQYSRFVRPESVRVQADCDLGFVKVSAFRGADGSVVVVAINNGHVDVGVDMGVMGMQNGSVEAKVWTTDNEHTVKLGDKILYTAATNGSNKAPLRTMLRRRSMSSLVLR